MEMMTHYNFIKYQLKEGQQKEPTVDEIAQIVASDINTVWQKASIPTVSHTRILKLIRCAHDEFRKLMKPYRGRKADKKYMLKLQAYANNSKHKLFDIAACKCIQGNCTCEHKFKVPVDEQDFLQDQRTSRLMVIGGVDRITSARLKRRHERKVKENAKIRKTLDLTLDLNVNTSTEQQLGSESSSESSDNDLQTHSGESSVTAKKKREK